MKLLILAVSLAIMQAAPPVPRETPNTSTSTRQGIQSHADDKKAPAATPTPTPQPTATPQADKKGNGAGAQNTEHTVRIGEPVPVSVIKDWADYLGIFSSFLLFIIGAFGVCYAVKTLRAIEKQAELMEGQLQEMREAGATTRRQVEHLINAERAWVQIPEIILRQKLSFMTPTQEQFHIWLHPYIVNSGRTHARITKIFTRAVVLERADDPTPNRPPVLPEIPDYTGTGVVFERNIVLSPKEGINWLNVPINVEFLERIKARQVFVYIYGCIDYLDISEAKRYTRFCRIYWIPYGPGDPVFQEGFAVSAIIPRAYTECT
jgi:hypothetical protein